MPTFPIWTPDGVPAVPAWFPLDDTGWEPSQLSPGFGGEPAGADVLADDFGNRLADDFGNRLTDA